MPHAKDTLANYLTETIRDAVRAEVLGTAAKGKLFAEPRIWNDLLSSQPLCFNLFGELQADLELAQRTLGQMGVDADVVTRVTFEHSPGRPPSTTPITANHPVLNAPILRSLWAAPSRSLWPPLDSVLRGGLTTLFPSRDFGVIDLQVGTFHCSQSLCLGGVFVQAQALHHSGYRRRADEKWAREPVCRAWRISLGNQKGRKNAYGQDTLIGN